MAKRRLSKQQQRRIADQQRNRLEGGDAPHAGATLTGRVISHHGRQLYVEVNEDGQRRSVPCKLRQNLGEIACGDRVLVETGDSGQYVVVAVQPRSNLLTKTGFGGSIKPVAANIDILIIVTAVRPEPNPYLIDRYLSAAENLPSRAIIVVNKTDLCGPESRESIDHLIERYRAIDYTVIPCSARTAQGLAQLQAEIAHQTSILVGLSGVGKSSLVKALLPDETIRIGATSQATGEGRHTTTVSALYHTREGGMIIDSPGVRDFTPSHRHVDEISRGFREIFPLVGHCRFSNCRHRNEPGCALLQALQDGRIQQQRYQHYLRLVAELEE